MADVETEDRLPLGAERASGWEEDNKVGTNGIKRTHTSSFSSTTAGIGTASISAITLCETTNTASDVVADDAFITGVGHDCFLICIANEGVVEVNLGEVKLGMGNGSNPKSGIWKCRLLMR